MAYEIQASCSLTIRNGDSTFQRQYTSRFDQAAVGGVGQIQSIPTTAGGTAITLGGLLIANAGWSIFRNLDDTNFVEIGVVVAATFYALIRIGPGGFWQGEMNQSNAPYARADTAAVNLEYYIGRA